MLLKYAVFLSHVVISRLAESKLAGGRDGYEAIFPFERFVVAPLYTCALFRNLSCLSAVAAPPRARLLHRAFWHWARGQVCHESSFLMFLFTDLSSDWTDKRTR